MQRARRSHRGSGIHFARRVAATSTSSHSGPGEPDPSVPPLLRKRFQDFGFIDTHPTFLPFN